MSLTDRIRVHEVKTLSDDWYVLKKTTFDFRRSDGSWQRQSRETYDRGDGAVILLYSLARRTVVLVRQFRYPAFVNAWDDLLVEAPAGLLEKSDPADAIRREVEEETGYRVRQVQPVFQAFMSPGSVTERLHFFVAEFDPADRISAGGGDRAEGEDIEVLELGIETAMAMIASGEICDAKTIMLLQYAVLNLFADRRRGSQAIRTTRSTASP